MESEWRGFLTVLTQQAVEREELRLDLDIDQFVWDLCAIYLGHHVSYRLFVTRMLTAGRIAHWMLF